MKSIAELRNLTLSPSTQPFYIPESFLALSQMIISEEPLLSSCPPAYPQSYSGLGQLAIRMAPLCLVWYCQLDLGTSEFPAVPVLSLTQGQNLPEEKEAPINVNFLQAQESPFCSLHGARVWNIAPGWQQLRRKGGSSHFLSCKGTSLPICPSLTSRVLLLSQARTVKGKDSKDCFKPREL